MIAFDKNKVQHLSGMTAAQYMNPSTAAPHAMLRAYRSAQPGMSGLGLNFEDVQAANEFNPEPISKAAIDVVGAIQRFFGGGRGRMEADRIVPFQNNIHYNILAPIAEAVNAPYRDKLSSSQLGEMLEALLTTQENWLHFLHDTEWTDGRAATQAENTLVFLFDDQERKLRALLQNAPYFSNVEEIPVYTIQTAPGGGQYPGGGSTSVQRVSTSTAGPSSMSFSSVLPFLIAGVAIFMLPKFGK